MQNPLVSIIIPTYNRAHLISETLDSVLEQTYTNWECIVVDDGSTDDTETVVMDYVNRDTRFQFHKRPEKYKSGGNGARNYGFDVSKGELVQWFDDDDIMLPIFLMERLKNFNSSISFIICSHYYTDENFNNPQLVILNEKPNLYKEYCLGWKFQIITGSVIFNYEYLKGKKLFNENLIRSQEAEFFSRIFFQEDYIFKVVNTPTFLYRQHKSTKSNKNKKYLNEFKESETFVFLENFKRSVLLKDKELTNYYYKLLTRYFFRGLENNHFRNSKRIFKEIIKEIKEINFYNFLLWFFIVRFLLLIKRPSYRFEKILVKRRLL